jgi:hypothetical protein
LSSKDFAHMPTEESLLTRPQTADELTAAGYPVKEATLTTLASRGGGPRYSRFGNRTLYRWADALEWAQARMTKPHVTAIEHRNERKAVTEQPRRPRGRPRKATAEITA